MIEPSLFHAWSLLDPSLIHAWSMLPRLFAEAEAVHRTGVTAVIQILHSAVVHQFPSSKLVLVKNSILIISFKFRLKRPSPWVYEVLSDNVILPIMIDNNQLSDTWVFIITRNSVVNDGGEDDVNDVITVYIDTNNVLVQEVRPIKK